MRQWFSESYSLVSIKCHCVINKYIWFWNEISQSLSSTSALQGVCVSVLCRDVAWLTEEVLFRNKDVGFGGSLVEVVYHSLMLLTPHLSIAAISSRLIFLLWEKTGVKYAAKRFCLWFSSPLSKFSLLCCPCLPAFLFLGKTPLLLHILPLLPHSASPCTLRLSYTPL